MKLRDYLDREKLTITAFAGQVGVSHAAIVRYINGTRRPEWPVIDKIAEITKGDVRPDDFFDAPAPAPAPSEAAP